jgi:hypothetical protein
VGSTGPCGIPSEHWKFVPPCSVIQYCDDGVGSVGDNDDEFNFTKA